MEEFKDVNDAGKVLESRLPRVTDIHASASVVLCGRRGIYSL